ncbi:ATP-dependent dethiobiotin synthetase BioD [Holospora obtusa F1]|uniref:ATP-dependent dethiobiotin synthetase BioD n=1 Tax=Holospora obtusa F1 TaxID=1399147 RepID=W6TDW6_HOLOB|nr:dethiobiotin synthase [Holospora obtusa]ETZ07293.1 ATP-dependent dethiobiotin synthetase BioD [Holospora obtusa F1]
MKIFITGTDTNVGKTVISAWIAIHTKSAYFKPIQTGEKEGSDCQNVKKISPFTQIYSPIYGYQDTLSPHLAANLKNDFIQLKKITLPRASNIVIEGAGGILVPLNETHLMIDLIQKFDVPVILVSRTSLGTINHTLLSLEALRARNISILGVIMNGDQNTENSQAIKNYGRTTILAEFPKLCKVSYSELKKINFSENFQNLLFRKS